MPEVMTEPIATPMVQAAPVCTCGKSLTFDSGTKSWRCFGCNPVDPNSPICKTQICKRPLTWMEKQKCWRCLVCNPIPKNLPKKEERKPFLDVHPDEVRVAEMIKSAMANQSLTGAQIREIVQDELMNWHIQKPPATRDEIAEAVGIGEPESNVRIDIQVPKVKPETWLQKAKRLGVKTHYDEGGMRKKVDVMADMEAKEKEVQDIPTEKPVSDDGFVSPEGDTKTYEAL